MKIKRFDLLQYINYPVIINPVFLFLVGCLGPLYLVLLSWWEVKKENKYWNLVTKSPRYEISKIVQILFSSVFNLWFWNTDYAKSYSCWWLYRYLYFEIDNGYHRPGTDPVDRGSKIDGETRRERVLNLYWKIFINHKTIWNKNIKGG